MHGLHPTKERLSEARRHTYRVLLRIVGAWCRSQNHRAVRYDLALQCSSRESDKTTVRTTSVVGGDVHLDE